MELEDLEDLIDLRVTHEQRLLLHQLSKDATDGPHVDAERVLALAEKDLRSSVPKGLDLVRKRLDRDGECSGKAEVTDLDIALVGDKQVLWLEISVDDPFGMAVVDTS